MVEVWKDIKGYEGKYKVSNTAKILSMNYNNTKQPKELKQKVNKLGFLEVKLSKNNKTQDLMVARLVGQHFVPGYVEGRVIINKDGNKLNCYADNLKWVLPTEQRHIMYNRGNRKIGKPSGKRISYHKEGYNNYSELAEAYRIDKRIFHLRLNRGWSLDEIIKIPIKKENKGKKPFLYRYYDKLMTVNDIAEITGINPKLIQNRLNKGWNIYEASEIIKGVKRNG